MKFNKILSMALYLLVLHTVSVEPHFPWKFPVNPGQQNARQPSVCTECLKKLSNLAKIFNIPGFSQFGNIRTTTTQQPSYFSTTIRTLITDNPQTFRPPFTRRPTAIVQPGVDREEINRFTSTEDRIRAILRTSSEAPVAQQSLYDYPAK
ncbi:unnamed protein product [Chironomus riparius]|uniref:Uncharacterized protein n=1 Tax=Chironomus riparius TaxID=315576 RepID=A0A9N9WPG4_9DIPT|nr:unnamed protein product [Chironomus riparius]